MTKTQYIMSKAILSRLNRTEKLRDRKFNPKNACMLCRVRFKVGDFVHAMASTGHPKRYHVTCAKKVHIV